MRPEERLAAARAADAAAEVNGSELDVVLFWGHKPSPDGSPGHGCLSQWWSAPFTVDGTSYPTAEHWMMAGKARLFDDQEGLAAVLAAPSPGAAKAAGRRVRRFDEERWVDARYDLVRDGNLAKFTQHAGLRQVLLHTGNRVLAEASPFDRIWGIGMTARNPGASRPSCWQGLNLLGFALMDVREQLRGSDCE